MLKRTMLALTAAAVLAVPLTISARGETVASEAAEHPRIAKAVAELEEAIKYLEAVLVRLMLARLLVVLLTTTATAA